MDWLTWLGLAIAIVIVVVVVRRLRAGGWNDN